MGKAGSGKSLFASNKASDLFKEGKKVLFIDYYRTEIFSDAPNLIINPSVTFGGDFENFKYEDFEKIIKDFIQKNSSAKISILEGEFGTERTQKICSFLADFILINQDIFSGYSIFIDEVNRFDVGKISQLLSQSKNNNISYTIIHQYLDQFSKDMAVTIVKMCKNLVFRISLQDSEYIASIYGLESDALYNLPQYEYRELGPIEENGI